MDNINKEEKSAVQEIADIITEFRIGASKSCSPNYIRVSMPVMQQIIDENSESLDPYLGYIPTGFSILGIPIELMRNEKDKYVIEVGRRITYTEEQEDVN